MERSPPAIEAKPATEAVAGRGQQGFMLEGPILPALLRLAAPNVLVVAVQTVVTISDAWFVGQLGTPALAALALVFPVQMLMNMMATGAIGGGISSAIARALGAGQRERAEHLVQHALVIALVMAAMFMLVFGWAARPLFALLGGAGEALDGAVAYARILFGGAAAIWVANALASVLRGTGNMRTPANVLVASSLFGIFLSGGFTLGWFGLPKLGVAGPGLSSVLTFGLSAIILGAHLALGRAALPMRFRWGAFSPGLFHDILKVGLVACANSFLTVATIILVTGLVGRFGTAALAGYGLGSRLELMLIPIAFGIGAALTAMVGTNRGAGQLERARRIAAIGGGLAFAITGLVGALVAVWPGLWIGFFTSDAPAVALAGTYLGIAGPFYGFFGGGMALYFASQGTGNMTWPFVAGCLRIIVAAGLGGIGALAFGAPVEWVFACVAFGLLCFGMVIALSLQSRVWRPHR